MTKTNIDLGYTYDKEPMPTVASAVPDKKHYPTFHYEGDEGIDIPNDGILTVKYHTVTETVTTREDGTKHYSCTVEIQKILGYEKEKDERPARSYKDAEEALDKLAEEKSNGKVDSDENY
jgi:hypothetical protein